MKNNSKFIILLILFVLIICLLSSCSVPEKVTASEAQPILLKQTEKPNLKNWKQIYVPDIKVGDSVFFYNSVEIVMEDEFFRIESFLDGAINITQTTKILEKTIPAMTSGELLSLKKDNNGKITDMFVSFSPTDKTYYLNFKLTQDGSFNLNGNAKLFFEGKEYPVLATIKGDVCKLLCVVNFEENIEYIKEKAEGVQ